MKNSLRLLLGVSALALLVTAAPAMAAEWDVNGENRLTGSDSDNNNSFDVDMDGDVTLENEGDVENSMVGTAFTGNNDQLENTEAGDLTSGDVDGSTDWETVVNEGASLMGASNSLDGSVDFVNDTTGADSDNNNELTVDNDGDLDLTNSAGIANLVDLFAVTGDNDQNRNTTAGDLMSGAVSVDSTIVNEANNDSGFAGAVASEVSVDASAKNHKTGFNSNNNNTIDIINDGNVTVENTADISNSTVVTAFTGNNRQNRNTTGGSVESGSVEVKSDVHNSANNGGGMSSSAGSSLDVSADFVNDTTGADSDNNNELTVDNDGDTTVTNEATVTNDTNVFADTGSNDQNRNTSGGDVNTGSVSFTSNVVNEVNNN